MPSPYARLRRTSHDDSDRELNDAFGDDDDNEATPLNPNNNDHQTSAGTGTSGTGADVACPTTHGAYDFERDYDHPPPGSPPALSSLAMPNSHGNSNGLMPISPIQQQAPSSRGGPLRFFKRTVGAILPSHYVRVPTADGDSSSNGGRVVGGGTNNDGVFSNVAAKPSTAMRSLVTDDGDVRYVPETQVAEAPPSYTSAQADAVPPYWENTIHVPAAQDSDTMIIEDWPVGTFAIFAINCFVSFLFQFVGFFLTYLVHATHAAKYGSRAGLGMTLIQFGFALHNENQTGNKDTPSSDGSRSDDWATSASGVWDNLVANTTAEEGGANADGYHHHTPVGNYGENADDGLGMSYASKEWMSFLLMTVGWVLLLSSVAGFWRVKRWEMSLRAGASPASSANTTFASEQQLDSNPGQQNIFSLILSGFRRPDDAPMTTAGGNTYARTAVDDSDNDGAGLPLYHTNSDSDRNFGGPEFRTDQFGRMIVIPDQRMLQEARLNRDLRAAGLI